MPERLPELLDPAVPNARLVLFSSTYPKFDASFCPNQRPFPIPTLRTPFFNACKEFPRQCQNPNNAAKHALYFTNALSREFRTKNANTLPTFQNATPSDSPFFAGGTVIPKHLSINPFLSLYRTPHLFSCYSEKSPSLFPRLAILSVACIRLGC